MKKSKKKTEEFKTNRIPQCQYIYPKVKEITERDQIETESQCIDQGTFPVNGYNFCFTHKNMFEHTPSKFFEFVMRLKGQKK